MDGQWQHQAIPSEELTCEQALLGECSTLLLIGHCPLLTSTILRQLADVARGVVYLHSMNIVHGDLKGVITRNIPFLGQDTDVGFF